MSLYQPVDHPHTWLLALASACIGVMLFIVNLAEPKTPRRLALEMILVMPAALLAAARRRV